MTPRTQKITSNLNGGWNFGESRVRIDLCRIRLYVYDRCRAPARPRKPSASIARATCCGMSIGSPMRSTSCRKTAPFRPVKPIVTSNKLSACKNRARPAKPSWHSLSNFHSAWFGASRPMRRLKDCPSARWSAERCSRCCREDEGVGEPKRVRQRALQLEYRFDRLLADKLVHVYQLLVPERRQSIGGQTPKAKNPVSGMNHEQASSDLCARVLGPPEGESHDCQPDCGAG